MGQSTDAILFYGYVWMDEGENPFDEVIRDSVYELAQAVALKRGAVNPYATPAEGGWVDPGQEVKDAWRAAKSQAAEEIGVELGSHCSGDYPMPYYYVVATRQVASRGYAKPISEQMTSGNYDERKAAWHILLQQTADELGVDLSGAEGPGWFLVSYWG